MFTSLFRWLFRATSTPSPRTVRLGLDTFEDRFVPSSVTFTAGVLYVQADENTNNDVLITAVGPHWDGSTGVRLVTPGR